MTILEKKVVLTYHEVCRAINYIEWQDEQEEESIEDSKSRREKYRAFRKKRNFIRDNYVRFIDDIEGANNLIRQLNAKFDDMGEPVNLIPKEYAFPSGHKNFNEAVEELKTNSDLMGKLDYFIKRGYDLDAVAYLCQYGDFDKITAYDIVTLANCGELEFYLK